MRERSDGQRSSTGRPPPRSCRVHPRRRSTTSASLTTLSWSRAKCASASTGVTNEAHVGFGERVVELPLLAAQQLGLLRVAQRSLVVPHRSRSAPPSVFTNFPLDLP